MPEPQPNPKPKETVEQAAKGPAVPSDWQTALAGMPLDWETSARTCGAVVRRREVRSAGDLLRLVLAYSLWDWSLRQVAAWACLLDVAQLSDVAVRKRLRHARPWLSQLVGQQLIRVRALAPASGVRLRLLDASVITEPGSVGTDWRVHVGFDVEQSRLDEWEVTDEHGGETLLRHAIKRGEIIVGDRAYGHLKGLGYLLSAGAQCLVRLNGYNLPLKTPHGQPLEVRAWLASLSPRTTRVERAVQVSTPQGKFALRLIAQRLPPAQAEAALKRARATSRKNGTRFNPLTGVMAGWVLVITNLPAATWSARSVLALYRVRWQVELWFKRCKSLIDLDQLRAKDPELAQVYLLGKALGVILLEDQTSQHSAALQEWFDDCQRPVSLWRWTALWWDHLRQVVHGVVTLTMIEACLSKLSRYLRDSPRRRRQQLAATRHWLARFTSLGPPQDADLALAHA